MRETRVARWSALSPGAASHVLLLAVMLVSFSALLSGCGSDSASPEPAQPTGLELVTSSQQVQLTRTVTIEAISTYSREGTTACDWYVDGVLGGDNESGTVTQENPATYTAPSTLPPAGEVEISAVSNANSEHAAAETLDVLFTIRYVDDATGEDEVSSGTYATPYKTIGFGLAQVAAGDTLEIMAGTYTGDNNKNLDFEGKAVVLRSAGRGRSVVIDCEGTGRGFCFQSGEGPGTVVERVTVTRGYAAEGGAVSCVNASSPTLRRCRFTNCDSDWAAGAIYCDSSSPALEECMVLGNAVDHGRGGGIACFYGSMAAVTACTLKSNEAFYGGGAYCDSGSNTTFSNCSFSYNTAESFGGGLSSHGTSLVVTECSFFNNLGGSWGGGAFCAAPSAPEFSSCTFIANFAEQGGGAYSYDRSSPVFTDCLFLVNGATNGDGGALGFEESSPGVLTRCSFLGNEATADGGGIHCQDSPLELQDCQFDGNSAAVDGGGIHCQDSPLELQDCQFDGNSATDDGGGIHCDFHSPLAMSDCGFSGNSSGTRGGGVCSLGGEATIAACRFDGNSAHSRGGGFHFDGGDLDYPATLTGCTFTSNVVTDGEGYYGGGGLSCSGATGLTLADSEFRENFSNFRGGGLYFGNCFPGSVSECTFSGNEARSAGGGAYVSGKLTFTLCTFWGNTGTESGSGLWSHGDAASLTGCILAAGLLTPAVATDDPEDPPTLTCCDVFGNAGGDWVGCIAGQNGVDGNISEDPLFCNPGGSDFHLGAASPCAEANNAGCGQIGAWGVGCSR